MRVNIASHREYRTRLAAGQKIGPAVSGVLAHRAPPRPSKTLRQSAATPARRCDWCDGGEFGDCAESAADDFEAEQKAPFALSKGGDQGQRRRPARRGRRFVCRRVGSSYARGSAAVRDEVFRRNPGKSVR
jgi:hypothetical protein